MTLLEGHDPMSKVTDVEVSAFSECFLFAFRFSRVHFKRKSAHVACLFTWLIGFSVALVPLLPMTEHWHFYSQNGICIPLPITRNDFKGAQYSFVVIIVVNFILFLLIAVGQVLLAF